ncbi:MAG: small conductance mechanosensitive channel [Thermoleophilaceae bacterium]|jgi:small-conductance mechanosensitive channel|nr:small conductance mechanosensitive channel [Thermoleophilaceae bacterium]
MANWMPETKSHAWEQAGLAAHVLQRNARRARFEALVIIPSIIAVFVAFDNRRALFPHIPDTWIRVAAFFLLVILGYRLASDIGRALSPILLRRVEPGTAGTLGFLIRLATIGIAIIVALRVAGLDPQSLAVGSAITGVIIGLAAQQTLGNVFAGMVLISARPLRVGERVRLLGGNVNGQLEATVSSLGMLYATFMRDGERIMIPNNIVMQLSIMPLHEPTSVDLLARLSSETRLTDVQTLLSKRVSVPTRGEPRIDLEEVDGDEVVVRVTATPLKHADGGQLADEVLAALSDVTRGENGNQP